MLVEAKKFEKHFFVVTLFFFAEALIRHILMDDICVRTLHEGNNIQSVWDNKVGEVLRVQKSAKRTSKSRCPTFTYNAAYNILKRACNYSSLHHPV